jgi:hypothetical protein
VTPRAAILVLAHRVAALQCLLDALDGRFAVFVHLDAETDAAGLRLPAHARLIAPRIAVHWGGWSMMAATIALLHAARGHAAMALVSGDSLPVLPPAALEAALLDGGPDRIDLTEVPADPSLAGMAREAAAARDGWEQPWRFQNFVHWDDRLLNPFGAAETAGHFGLAPQQADWLRGEAQRLVGEALAALPPRPALFPRLFYGAQWWALRGATVERLLPELARPEVLAYFRFLPVPDEHMVQTVLGNMAPHATRRAPVWHAPTPLDVAALRGARAVREGVLFARKFDPALAPEVAGAVGAGGLDGLLEG